jgi:malate synthase
MLHNDQSLVLAQSGPFFYLSKVEGANEAQLWNHIFVWAQEKLFIPQGKK